MLWTRDWLVQRLMAANGEVDEDQEEEFYMMRLDAGLFTLQLIDLIMIQVASAAASSVGALCYLQHS